MGLSLNQKRKMNKIDFASKLGNLLPFLRPWISKIAINGFAFKTPPRPRPYSLWSEIQIKKHGEVGPVSDYTSWPSLTDRLFSGRHLAPADATYIINLPVNKPCDFSELNNGNVTALFKRVIGKPKKGRSTVLFPYFAQWFTDSFLRSDSFDRRKNTSNHEIDLCQIYGLTEETCNLLRMHQNGKLASQLIGNEEFPEYLYEDDGKGGLIERSKFNNLPYVKDKKLQGILDLQQVAPERRKKIYATGLERGNSSIGYVSISILFLREHNRLCEGLKQRNPEWLDERLFQTARLINIVMLLRIVIEDYINHIAGARIFLFDNTFAEKEQWYRANWIALEFDILYRWHGLIPDTIDVDGTKYKPRDFQHDNGLLESLGLKKLIGAATTEQAGKIGLFNTPDFLLWADCMSIKMGRDYRLRSYNEYRVHFGLEPLKNWAALTSDIKAQEELSKLYCEIDKLEFVVGIFAEEAKDGLLFGELLLTMVAVDAFTQALTNPILSQNVFNAETLTQYGLDEIARTSSLQALVDRNVVGHVRASFDYKLAAKNGNSVR
jgi:prostaglandin-endoperoxide synthase 2